MRRENFDKILLGRHRLILIQGTLHGMPGEDGAFDAAGVFPDTGENSQFS